MCKLLGCLLGISPRRGNPCGGNNKVANAVSHFCCQKFCWLPPRCPAFPCGSLQTHCWTYLVSLRALHCSFSFWLLDWFPLRASIMVLQKGNYFMSFALSWESCMYPSGSPCPDEEWSLYVFSIFLVSLLLLCL